MLNRRDLFKVAGAATVAAAVPAAGAAPSAKEAAKIAVKKYKGGVVAGPVLKSQNELKLSRTFELGKIERLDPVEFDKAPSLQLQAIAQQPYNAARIRYPMVRKSYLEKGYKAGGKGRGSEPFVRVTWDKALELVASELKRVREKYGSVSIYGGSYGWMSAGNLGSARNLMQRVLNLNGGFTGHYGDYSTGCAQVILPYVIGSNGVYEQQTAWEVLAEKCELLVMWGADPTVTNDIDWVTTIHENAEGMEMVKNAGVPVIAVNPLKPDAAEYFGKNCEWIAPKPGTDVAMMIAMAHELESSGKVDREFIRKFTVGYDKFIAYVLGKTDGVAKTPAWAEKICGVKADAIKRLAHLMREKRSMLMGGWGIQRAQHGEQVHWMMVVLAAMCGHIGQPGGGFGFSYHYSNGGAATSMAPALGGISANPKGGSEGLSWVGESLATIPLARFADIVLPACTSLERVDITSIGSYSNLGYVAMQQAIEPQYESHSDFWIYRELSKKMGFEKEFTEGLDEMGWIRRFYENAAKEARVNGLEMPSFEEFWARGYVLFPVDQDARRYNYLGDFRHNPIVNPLGTESGKIEIFSKKIESYKYDDCPAHPTWMEPTEWLGAKMAEEYPFALLTSKSRYRLHSQLDSTASNLFANVEDREPVWIHPDAAKKLGLKSSDVAKVTSRRGSVLAGVIVTDRIRPDTVVIHHGGWYSPEEPGEEGSLDVHGCDNVLTIDIPSSKLSCGNVANSTQVKIERWDDELEPIMAHVQPKTERADD